MSMWPRFISVALLVCCFLVVGGISAEAVTVSESTGPSSMTTSGPTTLTQQTQSDELIASNTTLLVQIQSDGDARWTISERFNLSTETEREAFIETADAFEGGNVEGADLGLPAFRRAVEQVDARTERNMAIDNVTRSSSGTNGTGTLSLSFTWSNFARIENGTIRVDRVLDTGKGPWLPGLTENQQLIIRAPEDFGIDNANVPPQNGELRWQGPVQFTNETLESSFVGEGSETVVSPTPTVTQTPPPDPEESSNLLPSIVGGMVILFILALLVTQREQLERAIRSETDTPEGNETATDTPEQATPRAQETETVGATEPGADESEEDIELLSDEERVERLLEENGGRMKQANIVKETDWSNAKVSQLLSAMDDDDRINKLRIGRENLISLPDEDITDFDYDDDK